MDVSSFLQLITSGRAGKDIHAEMIIIEKNVKFQIDCGSTVNLIPESVIADTEIKPTMKSLIMWNKSEIKRLIPVN